MTPRPRILVLRGGAIGDFILTLPGLQALRERWPDAHIELIGYPHIARLGLIGKTIDVVDSLDRAGIARLFALGEAVDPELQDRVRPFDLALSYLYDPDHSVRRKLEAAGVAQVIQSSPIHPLEHAADHLARPLESLAIYAAGQLPIIRPDPAARAAAEQRLQANGHAPNQTVFLHPGSGSRQKNWPIDRYLELARRLRARGMHPVFTFGEADTFERDAIHAALPADGAALPDTPDLCDLAALLASGRGFVGNDSGITHLAAAVNSPAVALFGPTDPTLWGPRGRRVSIVRAEEGNLHLLPVEKVESALLAMLADEPGKG